MNRSRRSWPARRTRAIDRAVHSILGATLAFRRVVARPDWLPSLPFPSTPPPPKAIPQSGVFARPVAEPTAFEVRAHARGYAVFAAGVSRPLTVHPTVDNAIDLATALARRSAAPVRIVDTDGSVRTVVPSAR